MQTTETRKLPHTEAELFDLAATFSRRQAFDFRVPNTKASHKVECVIMEPSDVAMFASAIGVPSTPASPEESQQQAERLRRRLTDRLVSSRHLTFDEPERQSKMQELADEYYRRAEDHDRAVCTGKVTVDGIMPANPHEAGMVSGHALKLRRELIDRAVSMGYTADDFLAALRRYDHRRPTRVWAPDGEQAGRELYTSLQGRMLLPSDRQWGDLDPASQMYWHSRAAAELRARDRERDPFVRLGEIAREMLRDQNLAAGGCWPVSQDSIKASDVVKYVALGSADEIVRLFPEAARLRELRAEIARLERERDELRGSLRDVRQALQVASANGTITNTVFMLHAPEGITEFIDGVLGDAPAAPAEKEGENV